MYKISYANNQYILTQQNEEVIQQDFPYVIDYVRKISINNWETINEKNIKVEVDYGNNNIVLLQTTITNLYGDY